jgi:thiamine pyrophosphate-dependent acetolactate synthase large subunit-like protein
MTPRRFRRSVPDQKIVDRAFAMLEKAKRPIILAGNGCIRKRASKQLRLFCEQTGIGVISTFMAKGCVDMDADYCLYTIGLGSKDRGSMTLTWSSHLASTWSNITRSYGTKRATRKSFMPTFSPRKSMRITTPR